MGYMKHMASHTDTLIVCRAAEGVCPTVVCRIMVPQRCLCPNPHNQ